jgi:hypothetical protein
VTVAAEHESSARRELWRQLRRHPRDLPERLVVLAVGHQGAPARAWARERLAAGVDRREESDRLRHQTLLVSRVDGAVSGTPFFIALVPAYVAFLWTQTRMVLRIAALYGHDPTNPRIAAELLALRGVYPSVPEAAAALERIGEQPPVTGRRDRFASWVDMVKRILVLAAFTSASNPDEKPGRAKQASLVVLGAGLWIMTWVLPVTFMVFMAYSCDTSTRQLGAIALEYYSGENVERERGLRAFRMLPDPHAGRRALLRWVLLAVSVIVPIGLLVWSVAQGDALNNGARLLVSLVGLSIVIALAAFMRR